MCILFLDRGSNMLLDSPYESDIVPHLKMREITLVQNMPSHTAKLAHSTRWNVTMHVCVILP
jgi:hypothetical protein